MSRHLPTEVRGIDPAPADRERRRRAWLLDLRGWMFLGMGLAGILTVALIVTADSSYAGIDGVRAVRALVLANDADHLDISRIPFLGGFLSAIHDIAPVFVAPASSGPVGRPEPGTAPPEATRAPLSSPAPTLSGAPKTRPPSSATPSPASTITPTTPALRAMPAATPASSPTATPNVAISSDRAGNAIVALAGLVPGDSMTRTITVLNSGSPAFRYAVSATRTASTPLWTDTTDGLQLTVSTSGGTVLYAGPLSGLGSLAGPTTLAPGTNELLRYTFDFPASAPNAFQGLVQDLTLVFDAVEFP
jgi:hypothetical protein